MIVQKYIRISFQDQGELDDLISLLARIDPEEKILARIPLRSCVPPDNLSIVLTPVEVYDLVDTMGKGLKNIRDITCREAAHGVIIGLREYADPSPTASQRSIRLRR